MLFRSTSERHAARERNGRKWAEGFDKPADRASLLRHCDEKLARLTIFVQADCDVTFVPGDLEPVRQRHPRVRHPMPDRLVEPAADQRQLFLQFENALLKFTALDRDIQSKIDISSRAHVFCLTRV